ncbi:hypothetical protein D3C73_862730 [compost metagenome]
MLSLIDQQVEHVTYGTGTVLTHSGDRITARFAGQTREKSFVYPEAFEHYLRSLDPDIQEQIMTDLQVKAEQAEADKLRQEQLRLEEHARLAAEKLAAKTAKSRASRKAAPARSKG